MPKTKKTVYLDYAATTPVDPQVLKAMLPYFSIRFGNSMSLHALGQEAKSALEQSRKQIANIIGAKTSEIVFTGSASESNNLAIKGVAFANKDRGQHIIISAIEHPCIMQSAAFLEKHAGFTITRLKVDKFGQVSPADVAKAITKETILVSIMHANNEFGTIEPIAKIGQICRDKGVLFHTDASQTFGKLLIDVNKMGIDLLTASSHKIYGPKGAACLYIRSGIGIEPILHGGSQEFNRRASTVNVPAIVGFAKAATIYVKRMATENKRLTSLRDKLIKGVLSRISRSRLNGHPKLRLANNANFSFDFVEGESIILSLDALGIAASTGSACSSDKLEPSHALLAIGLRIEQAHGSLRLTLGRWTTEKDINYVLKVLPKVINNLRRISPFKK
ncbi:MAG: cysteine desulfurase NifS [Parcubacteria group bacterium CG10_big_fil_rev_8_21_14_0_10_35_15]|nr:MAG: cysteine desulfurase NifS [Parcubacteria group bacterium CG10_big_fil_rev_8_21_14_0_10_35_15]